MTPTLHNIEPSRYASLGAKRLLPDFTYGAAREGIGSPAIPSHKFPRARAVGGGNRQLDFALRAPEGTDSRAPNYSFHDVAHAPPRTLGNVVCREVDYGFFHATQHGGSQCNSKTGGVPETFAGKRTQ